MKCHQDGCYCYYKGHNFHTTVNYAWDSSQYYHIWMKLMVVEQHMKLTENFEVAKMEGLSEAVEVVL